MFRLTDRPRLLCGDVPFPECVTGLADGSLLATCGGERYDDPGPILRISADGAVLGVFADLRRRFLGVVALPGGDVVACDSTGGTVVRFGACGAVRAQVPAAGDWKLRKPNGAAGDGYRGVWVTDSGTARAGESSGAVIYLPADGEATVAWDGLIYPATGRRSCWHPTAPWPCHPMHWCSRTRAGSSFPRSSRARSTPSAASSPGRPTRYVHRRCWQAMSPRQEPLRQYEESRRKE